MGFPLYRDIPPKRSEVTEGNHLVSLCSFTEPRLRAVFCPLGVIAAAYHVVGESGGPMSTPPLNETSLTPRIARSFERCCGSQLPMMLPMSPSTWLTLKPAFVRSFATSPIGRSAEAVTIHSVCAIKVLPPFEKRRWFAAQGAWTRPLPTRAGGNASGLAVASSRFHSACPRRAGLVSAHSAAQPATCGVAMLVPVLMP